VVKLWLYQSRFFISDIEREKFKVDFKLPSRGANISEYPICFQGLYREGSERIKECFGVNTLYIKTMKFILGKKLGMSRKFQADGTVVPVTIVEAGPCTVVQIKTEKKDGYNAIQVGYGKKKNVIKPEVGHCKGMDVFRFLREFRVDSTDTFNKGDKYSAEVFTEGDKIKVTGISIGKGFQGGVKRHGFHGSAATHGHKDQERMPGSIGCSYPEHVLKGKRMAGQMGNQRATISNLEVVAVDLEKNQIAIKGGIPGPTNNLVLVYGDGVMEIKQPIVEEKNEEVKVEKVTEENIKAENSEKVLENEQKNESKPVEESR
jgi:large subunit ribosomal protein L3